MAQEIVRRLADGFERKNRMIKRYQHPAIAQTWSEENKYALWQETELAVIRAREELARIPQGSLEDIHNALIDVPCDIEWCKEREKELKHDLNAWVDERRRHLPEHLRPLFHEGLTSYDTEEPAFARMLEKSLDIVETQIDLLAIALKEQEQTHRYTPMLARSHGQWAQLQSFGKRALNWYTYVDACDSTLHKVAENALNVSKLSGAVGNYSEIDPELEREALKILGLEPHTATQIMPRVLYSPIASALADLVLVCHNIALDIRLSARSGTPLFHEPFGKKQMGSSAMPHKRNTILTENTEGMSRMAMGFAHMIQMNIVTWEERAIEQSSVERVAWPDLFHVVMRALTTMTKVISELVVYPENMMLEIVQSGGTYASNQAKMFLAHEGAKHGITVEDAYRMVQLAAFNTAETGTGNINSFGNKGVRTLEAADSRLLHLVCALRLKPHTYTSIQHILQHSTLKTHSGLAATSQDVTRWNTLLKKLFHEEATRLAWDKLFLPSYALRNEDHCFDEAFS